MENIHGKPERGIEEGELRLSGFYKICAPKKSEIFPPCKSEC